MHPSARIYTKQPLFPLCTMNKRRRVSASSSSSRLTTRQSADSNSTSSLPTSYNVTMLGYGISDGQIVYTMPITMGGDGDSVGNGTPLRVQLDTGSGDVWLASRSCRSDSCTQSSSGNAVVRYDAAGQGARDINQDWSIQYLAGSASGSVFTQDLLIGGNIRIIDQAFGSADQVQGEDLRDMNVTGVLGLAFPASSELQQTLSPDAGQDFVHSYETGSVLTGLWSGSQRSPTTPRMFGVGLQRLPSDGGGRTANSSFSLGGVDRAYLAQQDDNKVKFTPNLADSDGIHRHWKLYLSDITTNGVDGVVHIPASYPGQSDVYPTVVLDTGGPLNYAPSSILNAMYGAFEDARGYRLGPGENGIYYVPCDKPINITLTVGGTQIPIHPLDASLSEDIEGGSGSGSSVSGCIGSFQSLRAGSPAGADIILGAPFLRSAYSIYSCDPIPNGSNGTALFSQPNTGPCTNPAVALYSTNRDIGASLQEFRDVRVNGQSLGSNSAAGIATHEGKNGGLSAGAKIAIGIVGAIVGLIVAFGVLVWYARRRALKARARRTSAMDVNGGGIALEEKHRSLDDKSGGGSGGGVVAGAAAAGGAFEGGKQSRSRSRSRTTSGGGPWKRGSSSAGGGAAGMDLYHDTDLDDDDDDDGAAKKAMMSAKEQARLREAAILHGYYDEDLMAGEDALPHPASAAIQSPFGNSGGAGGGGHRGAAGGGGGLTAPGQDESTASWDVSSSGYVDARRVRREYLRRHPSLELQRGGGGNDVGAADGVVEGALDGEGVEGRGDQHQSQSQLQSQTQSSTGQAL